MVHINLNCNIDFSIRLEELIDRSAGIINLWQNIRFAVQTLLHLITGQLNKKAS